VSTVLLVVVNERWIFCEQNIYWTDRQAHELIVRLSTAGYFIANTESHMSNRLGHLLSSGVVQIILGCMIFIDQINHWVTAPLFRTKKGRLAEKTKMFFIWETLLVYTRSFLVIMRTNWQTLKKTLVTVKLMCCRVYIEQIQKLNKLSLSGIQWNRC